MAMVDCLLIDPTPKAILSAVDEAATAATEMVVTAARNLPVARSLCAVVADHQGLVRLIRQVERRPEGRKRWRGKRVSDWPVAQMVVAWWTDAIGRRHVRVRGFAHARVLDAQPLAEVYPERVVVRQRGGVIDTLAICACGLCGSPPALVWMGERCGPCHDRNASEGHMVRPIDVLCAQEDDSQSPAIDLAFLPDGRTVLANHRHFVRRWDLAAGTTEVLWEAHDSFFQSLIVHPDGERVFTTVWSNAGSRVTCRLLSDGSAQEFGIPGDTQNLIALSPDGSTLVAGQNELFRVDLCSGTVTPLGRSRGQQQLLYDADGTRLFLLDNVGGIHSIPAVGGESAFVTLAPDHRYHNRSWEVSANRRVAACRRGDDPRIIDLWSADGNWRAISQEARPRSIWGFRDALNGDGSILVVGDETGHLHFWETASGRSLATLTGLGTPPDVGAYVSALAFSPDGQTLAVTSQNGTLRIWPWRQLLEA